MIEVGLARALMLFVPLVAAVVAIVGRPASHGGHAPWIVAGAWVFVVLGVAHLLLLEPAGIWVFHTEGGDLLGLPTDVAIGWTALWGFLPAVLVRRVTWLTLLATLAGLWWLDLLLMPIFASVVTLAPGWWWADGLLVAVAVGPGLLLADATRRGWGAGLKGSLQTLGWFAVVGVWSPALAAGAHGGSWEGPGVVAAHVLAMLAALFAASVQAFVEDGGGTAIPLDPPTRLVRTGPYAYLANPMQATTVLAFGVLALDTGWASLGLAALVSVGFSEGFARPFEARTLPAIWPGFTQWRDEVPRWWPRWRPASAPEATLWADASCGLCSDVAWRLSRAEPRGVRFLPAEQHPGRPLSRVTWECPGCRTEEGVAALCRVIERIHLGWAVVGLVGRLPGVRQIAQLFVDALGGGPRPPRREAA